MVLPPEAAADEIVVAAVLHQQEETFRQLADTAPTVLWITDPNGRCTFLSRGWEVMTGQKEDDGLGLGWTEAVHPEDRKNAGQVFLTANARREAFRLDYRVRRTDGEYRWAIGHGQPHFSDDGSYLGMVGTVFDIHERKLAEEAAARTAAESEQQRRLHDSILSTSLDLLYVFDLDHRFTYANQALLSMWGRSWEDAIGKNCLELGYEPWHAEMHGREIDEVVATRLPIHGEVPFVGMQGRRIYDYIFVPVFDAERRVTAVAGVTRDVTERKRTENLLEGQSAILEKIAHGDPLPSILTALTKLLERLTDGPSFASVLLLDGHDRFVQSVGPSLPEAYTRAIVGQKIGPRAGSCGTAAWRRTVVEVEDIARDPLWEDYREVALAHGLQACWSLPILAADGAVLGTFALYHPRPYRPTPRERGMAEVLTQTAALAIERAQRERLQQRSEEIAHFLARASAELGELSDPPSTLQKVAAIAVPAFADWCTVDLAREDGTLERLAVSPADPGLAPVSPAILSPPSPQQVAPHGVLQVLRTGNAEWHEEVADTLLAEMARDEADLARLQQLGLKSYLSVPMTRRGRPVGVLTFLTSHSGRRYTKADLLAAEDLAQRASVAMENAALYHAVREGDRRKDEFLATLAHELRNPLAPLRNALYLLDQHEADPITFGEARALMERQLNQLVHLVDDLLDVSRITRGKIELRRQRVPLAEVVRSAVEISQSLIDSYHHTLDIELPAETLGLEADPVRLAQVLSNLLNNSARYTERGGRIALRAERKGEQVALEVRDNGIGIAGEMLPRIFDMFAQADRSLERAQSGLGIGLTLVKRLVELHDGTVEAHSEGLGKGSRFTLHLPLARGSAAAPGVNPAPAGAKPASRRHRILVVDDNRDAASTLGKLLTRAGHEVHVAFDGLEAVAAAAEFHPGVVLLDIGLPGLNGYDAAQRIRAEAQGQAITLIALTGWGQEEDRRRGREAGFDHHLVKPVDYADLRALLESLPTHP